jgi:mycofactocin biosynthetic radical S-adenosylmethionine protein MftC
MQDGRAIAPTVHAQEGREHLLVWGDQGQWLLVDEACATLLTEIAPGKNCHQTLQCAVALGMGTAAELEPTLAGVWRVLDARKLLEGARAPTATRAPARISNVTLNLTNRCNLRCAWCYNGLRETREAPARAVIDALCRSRDVLSPAASLIVLGGEPFTRFDALLELIDGASEVFAPPVLVSTNGTRVRAEQARALAARAVEVQVSLDSSEQAEHDRVRGPGSFERAVRGIRHLVGAGVPTLLSMVYTARTWQRFEAYLELGQSLGVREVRFIPLRLVGQGARYRAELPDQARAFDHLLGVLTRRPELRGLLGRDYFSILVKQCARSTTRTSCGVGEQVLFIDADGTLYPCPNHVSPGWRLGSVLDGDLGELWERSPLLGALREQYRLEHFGECSVCAFRRWCAGDCRGEVIAAGGAARAPSVHCAELKQIHLRALWLAAKRDPRLPLSKREPRAC